MKIRKKALLYDISNMAFTIADCSGIEAHALHQVRDICQEGNLDRVARVLGLAYSNVLVALLPLISPSKIDMGRDLSAGTHDYEINFRKDPDFHFLLTKEKQLKIKETVHEYMVCLVLADWLGVVLPPAADVWKYRAQGAFDSLKEIVAALGSSFSASFRRTISPF